MKKLMLNTVTSLLLQITSVLCGFILPRAILVFYGSDVNGLISSITQLLHGISLLEMGIGAVVQSNLYKPLVEGDFFKVNKILVSSDKFFRKVAHVLVCYVVFLCVMYPQFVKNNFDNLYTVILILSMSISMFAQYYFGISNLLLLTADQKGYIHYCAGIFCVIANTAICVLLIKAGAGIHVVKLATSLIFLIKPLIMYIYVKNNYKFNRKIKIREEVIKQKWNGLAQHMFTVVFEGAGAIILTIFSALENVSVYAVYNMVVMGLRQLIISATNGIQAYFGAFWASKTREECTQVFEFIVWLFFLITTVLFGVSSNLILSFVKVYTNGIKDANYIVPGFAYLLILANSLQCYRLPYSILIRAANKYKETQSSYIISVIIDILISIVGVKTIGLMGVAVGMVFSMLYHTVYLMIYCNKYLIFVQWRKIFKLVISNLIIICISRIISSFIPLEIDNYISWCMVGGITFCIWISVSIVINICFYKNFVRLILIKAKSLRRVGA